MNPVLKNIKKLSGNKYAFSLDDKHNPYTVKRYIDTGCYVLNAVVGNGDIYSGMPMGKRITMAGPSSTAKSFFGAHMIKSFLDEVENSYVIFFESEGSTISEMATNLGIPEDRMIILPIMTVEDFRMQSVAILDGILEQQEKDKENSPRYIMCLDSIGMLASEKETKDVQEGKSTLDMTRSKICKSVFRLITMKLSLSETTLITIAHTYQCVDGEQNVIMFDDSIKNIKDIVIGDMVKTVYGEQKILETVTHDINSYIKLTLEDGKIIKCTPNHKFLLNKDNIGYKWIESIDIVIGDKLKTLDNRYLKVVGKKIESKSLKVYDISVENDRHYILDNQLVSHNTMEMFSKAVVSSGTGLQYASDCIIILSKAKQKEGTDHIGANITCNVEKSRYIPEGQKVKVQILFKKGISKYSSLVDMAQDYGVIVKEGNSYLLPNGNKVKMKTVKAKPEDYVPEFLDEIRNEILKRFSFASGETEIDMIEDEDEIDVVEDEILNTKDYDNE